MTGITLLNIRLVTDDEWLYHNCKSVKTFDLEEINPNLNKLYLLDEKAMFFIAISSLRMNCDFNVTIDTVYETMRSLYMIAPYIENNCGLNYILEERVQKQIQNLPFFIFKCCSEIASNDYIERTLCKNIYNVSKDIFQDEFNEKDTLKDYLAKLNNYQ